MVKRKREKNSASIREAVKALVGIDKELKFVDTYVRGRSARVRMETSKRNRGRRTNRKILQ